jgi:hypothetical protein
VAVALGRALVAHREELSAYLLSQGGAALAASVAGGQADTPNGYRFAYLCDATAVAAAGGLLLLLALFPPDRRRPVALALLGLVSISGAAAARDALLLWPQRPETFEGFHGQDTLIARAALRWEAFGKVAVSTELGHSPVTIGGIRRYRLDPELSSPASGSLRRDRTFRIVPPKTEPEAGERTVERIRDSWGRDWAVVLARRSPSP